MCVCRQIVNQKGANRNEYMAVCADAVALLGKGILFRYIDKQFHCQTTISDIYSIFFSFPNPSHVVRVPSKPHLLMLYKIIFHPPIRHHQMLLHSESQQEKAREVSFAILVEWDPEELQRM